MDILQELLGPASDTAYERESSRGCLSCRLEAGDWLSIPRVWWHITRTQAASMHLSIGVMPVVRLRFFELLKERLAYSPFWR
jgi:hypothetical protein